MKQRTKHCLYGIIAALLLSVGLFVGCTGLTITSVSNVLTDSANVSIVNSKPEVVWGDTQWYNPIAQAYGTSFKIPERYAQRPYTTGDGKHLPRALLLTMPDLKPLSEEKQACQTDMPNLKCLQGVLEVQFGHDLNRQVFKDEGINEDNYLNYYFDKSRGENYHNDVNTYYSKHQPIYGLTVYKRSKLTTEYTPAGKKIKLTDFDNRYLVLSPKTDVDTVIECPSDELNDEYIVKVNRKMPTCVHSFILKPYKMQLFLIYERKYLPQWQKIQNSTIQVINQFHQGINLKQGDK